jgi:hypothetical protein
MPDVMQALRAGVPLTLLVDLAYGSGPDSSEILSREGFDPEWAALSLD